MKETLQGFVYSAMKMILEYCELKPYRIMITDYFWDKLHDIDLGSMWFRQDDKTHEKHNLLKQKFGECYLSLCCYLVTKVQGRAILLLWF